MKGGPAAETLAGTAEAQIESIHKAFRVLSGAGTPGELLSRFRAVVAGYFGGGEVSLFRRTAGKWENSGSSLPRAEGELPLPAPGERDAALIEEGSIRLVHGLSDGSDLGLTLARRGTGGPYGPADLVSLRLLLTVCDNELREMAARRNEKELIFSLNHRVLQLNSLIDTGIEVASLAGEAPPHHLALERAAALTNASKGVSRVLHSDGTTEEVWFPHGSGAGGRADTCTSSNRVLRSAGTGSRSGFSTGRAGTA